MEEPHVFINNIDKRKAVMVAQFDGYHVYTSIPVRSIETDGPAVRSGLVQFGELVGLLPDKTVVPPFVLTI